MSADTRGIRITLYATLWVVSVGFGIVMPILPHLARELGATPFQIGFLGAAYAAVQFLVSPYWGRVSDRHGRKPVLVLGLAGLTFSFFVMGLAPNYEWLLVGRVLGGFLSSATIPTAQAMAADISSHKDRARAMGAVGAAISLGFIFGPAIGGALVSLGPSAPLWAGMVTSGVTALGALLILKEPAQRQTTLRTPSSSTGLALLAKTVRGEVGHLCLIATAVMFGQSTILNMLTLYLVDRFGANPAHAGLAFGLQSAMSVALQAGVVGPLVARFGESRTILIAVAVSLLGFASLSFAPTLLLAAASLMLTIFGMSLGRPAIGSAMSKVGQLQLGLTMGILASFESAGRALGPLWAGVAYQWWVQGPFVSVIVLYVAVLLFSGRMLWQGGETAAEPASETADPQSGGAAPEAAAESAAVGTRDLARDVKG